MRLMEGVRRLGPDCSHAACLAGCTWEEIGAATNGTSDLARAAYADALDRQELVRTGNIEQYRDVLGELGI